MAQDIQGKLVNHHVYKIYLYFLKINFDYVYHFGVWKLYNFDIFNDLIQ